MPGSLQLARLKTQTNRKEDPMDTNDAWKKGRDQARQGSGFSLPKRVYYPVREAAQAGYLTGKKSGK